MASYYSKQSQAQPYSRQQDQPQGQYTYRDATQAPPPPSYNYLPPPPNQYAPQMSNYAPPQQLQQQPPQQQQMQPQPQSQLQNQYSSKPNFTEKLAAQGKVIVAMSEIDALRAYQCEKEELEEAKRFRSKVDAAVVQELHEGPLREAIMDIVAVEVARFKSLAMRLETELQSCRVELAAMKDTPERSRPFQTKMRSDLRSLHTRIPASRLPPAAPVAFSEEEDEPPSPKSVVNQDCLGELIDHHFPAKLAKAMASVSPKEWTNTLFDTLVLAPSAVTPDQLRIIFNSVTETEPARGLAKFKMVVPIRDKLLPYLRKETGPPRE
jgi:hypothetical protein